MVELTISRRMLRIFRKENEIMKLDIVKQKETKDIFVKLNTIFKESCYITSDGYCIMTNENHTEKDRVGRFILKLTPAYLELISGLFEDCDIVLITDIKSLKESLMTDADIKKKIKDDIKKELIVLDDDVDENEFINEEIMHKRKSLSDPLSYIVEENNKNIRKRIDKMNKVMDDFSNMKNIPLELSEKMFSDYDYIELPIMDDSVIIISKSLFPLVSNANAGANIQHSSKKLNDELNMSLFKWNIPIMEIKLLLYSII